jgi:hypothetical protein
MVAISLSVFKHLQIQRSTFYAHIFGVTFTITTENAQQRFAKNYKRNFNVWSRYTNVLLYMVVPYSQRSTTRFRKRNFNVSPDTRTFFFLFSQRSTTRIIHASQDGLEKEISTYRQIHERSSFYFLNAQQHASSTHRKKIYKLIKLSYMYHICSHIIWCYFYVMNTHYNGTGYQAS